MGDRINVSFTDGVDDSPVFYGHWCGLRALKVANDLLTKNIANGVPNFMCNFIVEVMEGEPQKYSFYLYNKGEAEGAADWDNFDWVLNIATRKWTTSNPEYEGKELTVDEVEAIVKSARPCLYCEKDHDCGHSFKAHFCKFREVQ